MDAQAAPAAAPVPPLPVATLSERDRAILDFEHHRWRDAGEKHHAIRQQFGISAARYYQLLGVLIDSPAALAEDPLLVKRLQRIRDGRIASRAARRAGAEVPGFEAPALGGSAPERPGRG